MIRPKYSVSLALAAAFLLAATCALAEPASRPASVRVDDANRRVDVNRMNMRVANNGMFPWDPVALPVGLSYPNGTTNSILFASGLWLGGTVGGLPRVAVAEYSSEFGPGAMVGGVHDNPAKPAYVVYKVARWTGNAADSAHVARSAADLAADPYADALVHHSWSEYMAGAAPRGAPWRVYRLPNTATPASGDSLDVPGPDVRGDQMLWCVYNDADPARHTASAGSSAPLGVEVRQTVFAYDRPGPLGNTVFVRWDLFNRGGNNIPDLRMGFWSDPDIGANFSDDLAGCDTTRSLGYAYNPPWGSDPAFGTAKPVVGFDLLAERDSPVLAQPSGMDAFVRFINGNDPLGAAESWNLLRGLRVEGTAFRDPVTNAPTPFHFAGDPVALTGWLDPNPSNNKTVIGTGPRAFAPGDTLTFWMAIIVGQGETPIGSLLALRCASDDVQDVFDAGFAEPFAAPRACDIPSGSCPRGANWWAEQCVVGGAFAPPVWEAIVAWADSVSENLSVGGPPLLAPFCQALGYQAGPRDSAMRELLGLLANAAVAELGFFPVGGEPIGLPLETGVLAPPLSGSTVAGMLADGDLHRGLVSAAYENDNTTHRRALDGVENGLPFFGGGGGTAAELLGSTLDPATMPDSFPTVLLRFHQGWWQMAHRYLRLETTTGAAPAGGRGWRYGGQRAIPVTAWDLHTGRQLELAFCERAVTAPDGTLLAPGSQPASFDSTWAPAASDSGGFEWLWVLKLNYAAVIHTELQVDGLPGSGQWPALYALTSRRREASDVIDDGDGFRFTAGWPRTTSADALMLALSASSPADSEAVRLYRELAASLREVNLGLGIGPVCSRPAPFPATLVSAANEYPRVTMRWRLGEATTSARLEWRSSSGQWMDGGAMTLEPGGEAVASFEDVYEFPPVRRAYRLAAAATIGIARSDSVWVDAPGNPPALAMAGVSPNPALSQHRISFSIPSTGPAKLEVYDLNGRRTYERDLGTLAAGTHLLEIAPGVRFKPGVYFAVLRFGGERKTARFVAL